MSPKPSRPATPSSPKPKQQNSAASRAAARRAVAAAASRSGSGRSGRGRWWTVGAPVVVVVVIVGVLIAVKAGSSSTTPKSGVAASAASGTVASQVTSVPTTVLNEVGPGSATAPRSLSGAALTANGKPRVLYVGAEWCPYCAAERWPLAVALSRFGTLTGLGEVTSSPTDVDPSTASLTFHGAAFSSTYLSLTAREIYSNQVVGSGYAALDTLTRTDHSLFETVGGGAFPFLDVGGKYLFAASYNPGILQRLTQAKIADQLANPASPIAQAIDGSANVITAAICQTTGNQPTTVCSASGVIAAAKTLPRS